MEIETIMKQDVLFTPDEEAVRESKELALDLLSEYEYDPTEKGVNRIYTRNIEQKGWLYNLFRRSPFYNGNGQIVLPRQLMLRSIDRKAISDFSIWVVQHLDDAGKKIWYDLFNLVYETETGIVDETDICIICGLEEGNTIPKSIELEGGLKVAQGQKWSRVVSKFGKIFGLDKITDIRTVTHNGEEQPKDYGWNYQFAAFADAINPKSVEHTLVLSLNPIDFWTMSFGHKWASCHTIDKTGIRGRGGFSGEWSGGTESYMGDDSTFIAYYVDEDEREGKPYELCDKLKRCVFYIGEDKLIQSRVYPDGRDGGDSGLAKTIREIVQYVITQLLDTPNLWKLAMGTEDCSAMIITRGVHYPDYNHYEDCNVSYLRRINGDLNTKKITVGSDPICPTCGCSHHTEDWITCPDCRGTEMCARCGSSISEDDAVYCPDNGNYYCDSECAANDYVYYCEDDGCYHIGDNCREDDNNGYYYYYTDDGVWVDNENWYHSPESAMNAGAYYCDDDEDWHYDHTTTEDGYDVYDTDNCELVTIDGYYYFCERNFNGDYTKDTEEAVEDKYYAEREELVWIDALTGKIYSMETPYYEAESGNRYLSVAGARIAGEAVPLDNVIIVRSLINPAMEMGGVR